MIIPQLLCIICKPQMYSFITLLFFLTEITIQAQPSKENRPNIIIMMLDDLGYSDLGCYGGEIKTPNIDKLATNGLRFRNFYNTAKCHSSRVSLLTGLYSDQAGDQALSRGSTLPSELQKAGYSTMMVGKWHLDGEPTEKGFEQYFGHLSGATNFFKGDNTFRLNAKKWGQFGKDFYTTDANIKFAKQFLTQSFTSKPNSPFFLYIAHNAPHYPFHVKEKDFKKYANTYNLGWDVIRKKRYAKQLKLGIIPNHWQLSKRPKKVPPWSKIKNQQWESERMQAFAGMVDCVDQTTGDLIQFLKKNNRFDNTLFLICSDNGACPFDRTKGKTLRPWDPKSYWCYDTGWSHVCNTPFRLHKQNQHAGGIASPLIIHWPKGITQNSGGVINQRAHLVDFMSTCLEVAEHQYTANEPLQGISMLPLFSGKSREDHQHLFFRYADNRAIIQGDWKAVTHRASQWELYNLKQDGTEQFNLAKKHPEKLIELITQWHRMAKDMGRLPKKNRLPVSGKSPPQLQKNGRPSKK